MRWIALRWRPETAAEEGAAPDGREHARAQNASSSAACGDADHAPAGERGGIQSLALSWWALQFTPHVAWVDEGLLLEVSGTLRLWGGERVLLRRILDSNPHSAPVQSAQAATSLVALARLRMAVEEGVAGAVADLPLHTLSAARPHLPVLSRLGCRRWGDLEALPRAGLARRFGPELVRALDRALGRVPDLYPWATVPERFAQQLELPMRVDNAPALIWAAQRLLSSLQIWLHARQLGVRAVALSWRFDQRRLNGTDLPPGQSITVRTAEPVQQTEHLRRLLAEHLARTALLAPAVGLGLRVLDTAPWHAESHSLLPEERRSGDALHVFVERVSARLGGDQVLVAEQQADHRPERRQRWRPAQEVLGAPRGEQTKAKRRMTSKRPPATSAGFEPPSPGGAGADAASRDGVAPSAPKRSAADSAALDWPDALAPTCLLPEPLPLSVRAHQPHYRGALRLLTKAHRIEVGWCPELETGQGAQVARDYFIAQTPAAELLWIYRERPTAAQPGAEGEARWFLHGLYA